MVKLNSRKTSFASRITLGTATLVCISLSACVHGNGIASSKVLSQAISDEAVLYSQARKNATSGIIFSNILEARDRGIIGYSTISGVTSNPKSTYSSKATFSPLGLGNPSGPFQGSSAELSQGADKTGSYSVNPVASGLEAGSTVLYSPVPSSVFKNYWDNGWPKDVLLSLMVANYEIAGDSITNNGKSPQDFLHNVQNHLGNLDELVLEDLGTKPFPEGASCKSYNTQLLELALGNSSDESLSDRLKAIGKLYGGTANITTSGQLYVCPEATKEKGLKLYRKGNPENYFKLDIRSFDSMVYFIGETLRKPTEFRYLYPSSSTYKTPYNSAGAYIPLMTTTIYGDQDDFAVWTTHRGEKVYTVRRLENLSDRPYDRSQAVMTILRQVLELNQSKDFLKAPDNQFVVR